MTSDIIKSRGLGSADRNGDSTAAANGIIALSRPQDHRRPLRSIVPFAVALAFYRLR
jgi:hypothetical protein